MDRTKTKIFTFIMKEKIAKLKMPKLLLGIQKKEKPEMCLDISNKNMYCASSKLLLAFLEGESGVGLKTL
jgi:hypothetical protein